MKTVIGKQITIVIVGLVLLPLVCFAKQNQSSSGNDGMVAAHTMMIADRFQAYAQVEPVTIIKLKAVQAGTVNGVTVLPGESVKAGDVLGRLTGPTVNERLVENRSALAEASASVTAAKKLLAIERRKFKTRLATQEAVNAAEVDLAKARADHDRAQMKLQTALLSLALKAPANGTVLAVRVGDGEHVLADQTILTLQPAGSLWLVARYYGTEATTIRVGMTGRFEPADGSAAVPVKVRTIIGPIGQDGGLAVGLTATGATPTLFNGQAGQVFLFGKKQKVVAVPTRALILDRGQWWVVVRTQDGDRHQRVFPGPSRGNLTLIKRGLEAGTRVVVENAYLEFHRDLSRQYQQPD